MLNINTGQYDNQRRRFWLFGWRCPIDHSKLKKVVKGFSSGGDIRTEHWFACDKCDYIYKENLGVGWDDI